MQMMQYIMFMFGGHENSHYYFVSFRILIMIPYSLLFGHNIYSVSKKERSIFGVDLKKTRTIGAFLRAGESMWPLDRRYSVDHASDPKCVPQFRTKSWWTAHRVRFKRHFTFRRSPGPLSGSRYPSQALPQDEKEEDQDEEENEDCVNAAAIVCCWPQ